MPFPNCLPSCSLFIGFFLAVKLHWARRWDTKGASQRILLKTIPSCALGGGRRETLSLTGLLTGRNNNGDPGALLRTSSHSAQSLYYREHQILEEESSHAAPDALAVIEDVELVHKLVHGVAGLGDGAQIGHEADIIALLGRRQNRHQKAGRGQGLCCPQP